MKVAAVVACLSVLVASTVAAPAPVTPDQSMSMAAKTTATDSDSVVDMLILGGTEVPVGQALYTTGLRKRSASRKNFCGGSLISDRHVLTAAHCREYPIDYVSIGSHYNTGTKDGIQVAVKSQTVHPQHNRTRLAYDFLLLELATPVDTTKYPPIKLAGPSGADIVDGKMATALGWGATSENGDMSNVLLQVSVALLPQATCSQKFNIDESMVCAGGELYKDVCQGDSGGPLIVKGAANGTDVLIGVVSWGVGCGHAGYPGVYARVPAVTDWIASVAPGVQFTK